MKNNFPPLAMLTKFCCIACLLFCSYALQAQIARDLPREQAIPETYQIDQVVYRKSDHLVAHMYELNETAKGNTAEEIAKSYIETNKSRLGIRGQLNENIRYYYTFDGALAKVVRFRQYYKGLPVDNNDIIVTVSPSNRITSLSNMFRPVDEDIAVVPTIGEMQALQALLAWFSLIKAPDDLRQKLVVHFYHNKPVPCYRLSFSAKDTYANWVMYLDMHNGRVLEVFDNAFYQSTSHGNVFDPDPITSARTKYGSGGFQHNNDNNNSDLQSQLKNVQFNLGQFLVSPTFLRGTYAYDDDATCNNLTSSTSNSWNFNRNEPCFESVMCYYHITKARQYLLNFTTASPNPSPAPPGYPTAVRFSVGHSGADAFPVYNSELEIILFPRYQNAQGKTIDPAEDAAVIHHEFAHGANDWITGNSGNISQNIEGVAEGFADYWAQSYIRSLGYWKEYEPEYHYAGHWFMFTDELPDEYDRITDWVVGYPFAGPDVNLQSHIKGQLFSTALMRIYDDIGRYKTDLIAINGMAMTGNNTSQSVAALAIYSAAVSAVTAGKLTPADLCIVYQHFRTIYGEVFFNPSTPSSTGDYYIRDTPDEFGKEPNPDTGPMWLSDDIWVRNQNDGLTNRTHENPKFGQTNYLYVRVRSRGCEGVDDAQLYVYFTKGSSFLTWSTNWFNYYETTSSGNVLTGHLVSGAPVAIPANLKAGEEVILTIPWTNMPNPASFDTEKHHFCLLARIMSEKDPMTSPEGADVGANTRNNNNIAWKNITILEPPPQLYPFKPNGMIYVRRSEAGNSSLQVVTPELPGTVRCQSQGDVYVRLNGNLNTLWQNNGSQGNGFTLQSDGRQKMTGTQGAFNGLALEPATSYKLEVYYSPGPGARTCAFDILQKNAAGYTVGGERFIYDPVWWATHLTGDGSGEDRNSIPLVPGDITGLTLYPVPVSDLLTIRSVGNGQVWQGTLNIYDGYGRRVMQQTLAVPKEGIRMVLDVASLSKGLYFAELLDVKGQCFAAAKFTKI